MYFVNSVINNAQLTPEKQVLGKIHKTITIIRVLHQWSPV